MSKKILPQFLKTVTSDMLIILILLLISGCEFVTAIIHKILLHYLLHYLLLVRYYVTYLLFVYGTITLTEDKLQSRLLYRL